MHDQSNLDQQLPQLLGTGLKGLVGSRVVELLSNDFSFDNLDISDPESPVDITQPDQVLEKFSKSSAEWVLHFAAFTNVSAAWDQRDQTTGLAYQINVEGTRNVVTAAQATQKKLLHISTAYVFDGQKSEPYTETDPVHPIEWYGKTKSLAEQVVMDSAIDWCILRIDQPFKAQPFAKSDVAHTIATKISNNTLYPMFTDHYFGPTFIDDLARVISWVVTTHQTGIWHASSGESWTDFDFAMAIKELHHLDGTVTPGSLAEYLQTTQRPYQRNTVLNTQKLVTALDIELTSIRSALQQLKW